MSTRDDAGVRYVPPGSCTWCGHPPHATACASTIRIGKAQTSPCPCSKTTPQS